MVPLHTMNHVLTTHSTAFALEPPVDCNGSKYDSPLGDDLARHLVSEFSAADDRITFGKVIREDAWSTCDCQIEDVKFYLVVSYFPVDDSDDGWVIQFGQRRGLLWFLTKSRPDLLQELVASVERVLTSDDSRFSRTKKLTEAEFLAKK